MEKAEKGERLYELTLEQAEELLDKLPSHTKGQRKEIKRIAAGLQIMQPGERLFVHEDVSGDGTHSSLFAWQQVDKNHYNIRMISVELAVAVTRKYLAMKEIPAIITDVKPNCVA